MQFYDYFIVNNEGGIVQSIKQSIMITKGYTAQLFTLGAVLSIIIFLSILPLMIGLLISIPLSTLVNAYVFLKLTNIIKDEYSDLKKLKYP